MRNSILVKNSTYYISSLSEKGSLNSIAHMTKPSSEKEECFYVKPMVIKNKHMGEIVSDVCSAIVVNNIKDDILINPFSTSTIVRDREVKNFIDGQIITKEVANRQGDIQINIYQKEDKYEKHRSYSINVIDKHNTILSGNEIQELLSFDIVKDFGYKTTYKCRTTSMSVNQIKGPIEKFIPVKGTEVSVKKAEMSDYNCRTKASIVIKAAKREEGYESQPVLSLDVSNKVNGSTDTEGFNSGGDLKKLTFTIQQMSFFEFKFYFKENKVKEVFNLPQGLFFDIEGERIIGTPMVSGKYPISIIFEDDSIIDGIIEVPKLKREL